VSEKRTPPQLKGPKTNSKIPRHHTPWHQEKKLNSAQKIIVQSSTDPRTPGDGESGSCGKIWGGSGAKSDCRFFFALTSSCGFVGSRVLAARFEIPGSSSTTRVLSWAGNSMGEASEVCIAGTSVSLCYRGDLTEVETSCVGHLGRLMWRG